MRGIAVFASMLALACGAAAAPPKKKVAVVGEPPMQIYVVRSTHPGCEPECPQWIAAQGRIMPGTAKKFRKVLRDIGDRKLPIFIDSAGGAINDALAIGRLIRSKDLPVAVTRTVFEPCAPDDTACRKAKTGGELHGLARGFMSKCASACVFILAGGTRRLVGVGAAVGVHQATRTTRTYWVKRYAGAPEKTEKTLAWEGTSDADKSTYANMKKYFAEMGVSDEIVALMQSTPPDRIRRLEPWELEATRLSTAYLNGEQLVTNAAAPPAPSPPWRWQPGQPATGGALIGPSMGIPGVYTTRPFAPPGPGESKDENAKHEKDGAAVTAEEAKPEEARAEEAKAAPSPIKPPAAAPYFGPPGTSGEPSMQEVCFRLGRCDQFGWPKDVPGSSGTFPTFVPNHHRKGGGAK